MTDPPTNHTLQSLFDAAYELPAAERAAYLDSACPDRELRDRVKALLAHAAESDNEDRNGDGFLETPLLGRGFHVGAAAHGLSPSPGDVPPPGSSTGVEAVSIDGFEIQEEVGPGGQGVVFRAIQISTGRQVAIKVLHGGPLADPTARKRMEREVKALAALDHPNIVTVLHYGQTEQGADYLVMNFIAGRRLDDVMEEYFRAGKLSPSSSAAGLGEPRSLIDAPLTDGRAALIRLFLVVCDAVDAAHQKGITHRDLDPSNILVDKRGAPHVLDFGLASIAPPEAGAGVAAAATSRVSVTGQFVGKLAYASPEQARGNVRAIGPRSDVYSLGVMLYQIITEGQFPYDVSTSPGETLRNVISSPPRPLGLSRARSLENASDTGAAPETYDGSDPATATPLEAVLLRSLSKDPEARYSTAGELGRAVAECIPAYRVPTGAIMLEGSATHAGHSRARRVARSALALCVAAVLAAGVTFVAMRSGDGAGGAHSGNAMAAGRPPRNLRVMGVGETWVDLMWDLNGDLSNPMRVEQLLGYGWSALEDFEAATNSVRINGLTANQSCAFRVRSLGDGPPQSLISNVVETATLTVVKPTGLRIEALGATSARLNWEYGSDPDRFAIQRWSAVEGWRNVKFPEGGNRSAVVEGLEPNVQYQFAIVAIAREGATSSPSNIVNATLAEVPPAATQASEKPNDK